MRLILLITIVFISASSCAQDLFEGESNKDSLKKTEVSPIIAQSPNGKRVIINNNIPEGGVDLVTPIVSILSIIIGFVLNKWYDNYIDDKRIENEGNLWVENLIQLREPLERQIKILEEFIPLNDENTFEFQDLQFVVALECDEFKALDGRTLVPFLKQKVKGTEQKEAIILAGQIKSIIKIIESNSIGVKEVYSSLKISINPFMSEFQKSFNDFRLSVGKYLDFAFNTYTTGTAQHVAAENIKKLMLSEIEPYLDNGKYNLFEFEKTFIDPFFKNAHVDRSNPTMAEAIVFLNHCSTNIKAIKMEKRYFRIKLEKRLKIYKSNLDVLDGVLNNRIFPIK